MHRARPATHQIQRASPSKLIALPQRQRRLRDSQAPRLPEPSSATGVAVQFAVVLLLAMLLGRYVGFPPSMPGAVVCAGASAWAAARRRSDCRLTWTALAVACAGWAAGGVASRWSANEVYAEAGTFVFAIGVTAAQLAWPEMRDSPRRLIASLTDAVVVVATLALWGISGAILMGPALSPYMAAGASRPADLLLPICMALVVAPQLSKWRQRCAFGIAAALSLLFVSGTLSASMSGSAVELAGGALLLQAASFAVLAWAMLMGQADAPELDLLDHDRSQPPFVLPGLIAIVGIALALLRPEPSIQVAPAFAVLVGACLGGRELLRASNRRVAYARLASSLDLEARLLTMQRSSAEADPPEEALGRSCSLAAEVLRGSASLAWMAESDALVLRAVGGTSAPEGLVGRRIELSNTNALATRVLVAGHWEVCDATAPDARTDRFLSTLLDAGPVLGVPILGDDGARGALVLVRPRGDVAFSHWDEQKAALIAAQVGTTLRQVELQDELESQLREATLVHRFAVQAGTARSVNDIAWYLLESIRSRVPIDRASVYLADSSQQVGLTPVAYFPTRAPDRDRLTRFGEVHLRAALRHGETLVGYVELHRAESAPFSQREVRATETLGHQAAIAMQNLRLQVESGKVSTYRELDRLKTDLLNTVSHDLRAPLANIKGYAATLVESGSDMPPEEQREFLQTIEGEADRLRDLLNHLLDLSKIEAGVLTVEMTSLNLERLVQQTLASIQVAGRQYETRVASDLQIMADGRRLRQVLQNLLENAAKYSPDGGLITLSAAVSDGEVVISVADSGVGIPRHQWDRVFRPYQRADTATSHGISGNGLGLAICKGIVEAHGGRIWVESEPGVGSVFSFTVSRARVDDAAAADAQHLSRL